MYPRHDKQASLTSVWKDEIQLIDISVQIVEKDAALVVLAYGLIRWKSLEDNLRRRRIPRIIQGISLSDQKVRGSSAHLCILFLQIILICKNSDVLLRLTGKLIIDLICIPKQILEVFSHHAIV